MEDIEIQNLINELTSHRHAICLSNKNMVELIGLLKDVKFLLKEKRMYY